MNCLICNGETEIAIATTHVSYVRDHRFKCHLCGVLSKNNTTKDGTNKFSVFKKLTGSLWMSASFPIKEQVIIFKKQQSKIFPLKFTDVIYFNSQELDLMWKFGKLDLKKLAKRDWDGLRRLAIMI